MPMSFIWNRRTDLFGITLRNAINDGYPFMAKVEYDEDGNVASASGMCFNKHKSCNLRQNVIKLFGVCTLPDKLF